MIKYEGQHRSLHIASGTAPIEKILQQCTLGKLILNCWVTESDLSVVYTDMLGSLLCRVNSRWRFAIILLTRFELNISINMNQEIFPQFYFIATSSLMYRALERSHCISKSRESWYDSFNSVLWCHNMVCGWREFKIEKLSLNFLENAITNPTQFSAMLFLPAMEFYESGF